VFCHHRESQKKTTSLRSTLNLHQYSQQLNPAKKRKAATSAKDRRADPVYSPACRGGSRSIIASLFLASSLLSEESSSWQASLSRQRHIWGYTFPILCERLLQANCMYDVFMNLNANNKNTSPKIKVAWLATFLYLQFFKIRNHTLSKDSARWPYLRAE
jgi:hypothetical protein